MTCESFGSLYKQRRWWLYTVTLYINVQCRYMCYNVYCCDTAQLLHMQYYAFSVQSIMKVQGPSPVHLLQTGLSLHHLFVSSHLRF